MKNVLKTQNYGVPINPVSRNAKYLKIHVSAVLLENVTINR